ncbi:MAG: ABC-F family ATP-binding cassette domain-containing protein [Deltaproteobacteria bacterium]|nr:ABC-F family ATP-binding cassette domain-containing protein [Deltaproteobacteria bacterium]
MLQINKLTKTYGSQILFEDLDLQLSRGERLGLVGRNGHGKSTLFRLVLKEELPDEGSITFPRNYRVGHLAQHLNFTQPTVLLEGALGLPVGEEDCYYKVEAILFGLGFTQEDMDRSPYEFSGGYQIRLNLAKLLVSEPNLLLLDEPTNYLDIVSVRWITRFLRNWKDELILISHDREFMDSVTTHTAAIHRQKLKRVTGPTEKLYTQIEQDEELYEKNRVNEGKKRKEIETFINRFRAQASKAASVQSRIRQLEKMGSKDALQNIESLDFDFHYAPFAAKTVMEVNDLSFHYEAKTPLIQNLSFSIKSDDRIAIIGKNGKGKSTLLNVLAGEFQATGGSLYSHPEMKLGYFGQTNINRLDLKTTVEDEIGSVNSSLSRTQVRGICGVMMFEGDAAEKRIGVLSGGERSRVLLGKILAAPANLLFLDEPTNHLDMQSIDALVDSISNFKGAMMIVTHSEMILRAIATKLIVFREGGAELFLGNYDEFLEKIGWEEEEGGKKKRQK